MPRNSVNLRTIARFAVIFIYHERLEESYYLYNCTDMYVYI